MIPLILAAVLACTPTHTPGQLGRDSTRWDGPPPTRFRAHATFTLTTVDRRQISGLCDGGSPPPCPLMTVACTISGHVYAPDPCAPEFANDRYAAMVCHEQGHVNAWPATHGP